MSTTRWPILTLLAMTLVWAGVSGCQSEPEPEPEGTEPPPATQGEPAQTPADQGDQDLHPDAEPAPAFTLPDSHDQEHSLADYRGQWVVLEWINHECPFVVKHYAPGNMQRLQETYTGQGVAWLSICSSAPGLQGHRTAEQWNETTAEKNAQPTAVLIDPDGQVGRLYDATRTPEMVIIDPQGRLVYRGALDDRPTTNQADIEGATNYVEQVLDAVLAGQPAPVRQTDPYGCTVKYPQ